MLKLDFSLAPHEQIKYIEKKKPKLSFNYEEVLHEAHHKAFTVAKITKLDLLSDMQQSLLQAQRNGETFKQWKKNITPTLQKKGWWGNVTLTNPANPKETKEVYIGSRRLKTIFETNMRVSYATARYSQMYESENEYLRYNALLDSNTRPTHKKLHGIILHRNHKFWKNNLPPNGWNCRCYVSSHSKDALDKKGWSEHKGGLANIADKDWSYDLRSSSNIDHIFKQKLQALTKDCKELNARGKSCQHKLYNLAKDEAIVDTKVFKKWFKYPKNDFHIASLPPKFKKALNAKSSKIMLSKETLTKNKKHHADIEWFEYLLINHITQKSDAAVLKDGKFIVAIKGVLEEDFLIALKVTKDLKEIFVTSFRRTTNEDIKREFKKGKKI